MLAGRVRYSCLKGAAHGEALMCIQWALGIWERHWEQVLGLEKRKLDGVGCGLRVIGARLRAEVGNELVVCGQVGHTTPAGGAAHRVRELGMVVSCGGSGEKGWRTELELGSGKSLDDRHGTATWGTEPKRAGGLDPRSLWFGLRRRCGTE